MKYFLLFVTVLLAGCQTPPTILGGPSYTKLTVTDFEGEQIAEWIAEGLVRPVEQGYSIRAVQRTSGGAYPVVTKYPNGWRSTVTGPNIVKQPVDKPDWLAEIDGEIVAKPGPKPAQ